MSKVTIQIVHMSDSEWSSQANGRLMDRIAEAVLLGENPPDIVEVHEHGGWFLQYAMLGQELTIVGSANEGWLKPARVLNFLRDVREIGSVYLPEIRRTDVPVPVVSAE